MVRVADERVELPTQPGDVVGGEMGLVRRLIAEFSVDDELRGVGRILEHAEEQAAGLVAGNLLGVVVEDLS